MAYLLIANSYQSKYASLANVMVSHYLMKDNKYPKDIMKIIRIMIQEQEKQSVRPQNTKVSRNQFSEKIKQISLNKHSS